ncbi:MAG: dTDP-4-amino-4,6-dideoxygalactose transaminase [Actinomycetota bacterium]
MSTKPPFPERSHEQNRIRFNVPPLVGSEFTYIQEALQRGHVSSSGPFSERAAEVLRAFHSAQHVFLTTSCTDALEMTAMLLRLNPGDVVIVPSFSFVSTALAFARSGARLLFADIERDTLGIDPAHVAHLVDERVRAVVAVHYAGVACDMDGLASAVAGHSVDLIEDNAQGLFGFYRGRALGSFGRLSTLSFHETKNFVCGEGGALVVNDEKDVERAHVLYDKGTNRRAFMSGLVDKYSWVDEGSSFGMSDVLAAYLLAQLEARESILSRRRQLWNQYNEALAPEAASYGFETPHIPPDRDHPYHMYYVLLPTQSARDAVLSSLARLGIAAAFHYIPLHNASGAQRYIRSSTECPVTSEISSRLLRLPFHSALEPQDVAQVTDAFLRAVSEL